MPCSAAERNGKKSSYETYAGRAVYIYLDQELRAKLEFASDALSCHLDAIQATVFNRVDGKVDTIRFLFSDLLGVKKTNHPSFPQGIVPHLLEDGNKLEWHVYQPSAADYRIIAESLDEISSGIPISAGKHESENVLTEPTVCAMIR